MDAHLVQSVDDPNGIWRTRVGEIAALGLLLEPWAGIEKWVLESQIDLLFVHRPWSLPERLPGNPGVLAYHLAFDERLTVGFNPLLASSLEMTEREVLGLKSGCPIGMIGNIAQTSASEFTRLLARTFAAEPAALGLPPCCVDRVAIAGASWPRLMVEAARRGADIFVTGTLRAPARSVVNEIGLPVLEFGHRPAELWGLQALARVLRGAFPNVSVQLTPFDLKAESTNHERM